MANKEKQAAADDKKTEDTDSQATDNKVQVVTASVSETDNIA